MARDIVIPASTDHHAGPDADIDAAKTIVPVAGNARPAVGGDARHDGARAVPRVAIVHEWLETFAGSERVLEQMLLCFPDADLFAVVDFMGEAERRFLGGRTVRTTFVQRLPFARRLFRQYLGLMPLAIQQLDLAGYDLVLSSSHAVAKGALTGPDQVHVSYVHSPMRYVWDLQNRYLAQARMGRLQDAYARWLFNRIRQWDVTSAANVDRFVANSRYIARRIGKAYRRDASVVHPPVDVERFRPGEARADHFLLACRFVPYKRADLVVAAFRRCPERRLVVVGDGPEAARVRAAAGGAPNIAFRGPVPDAELVALMQTARAFVFAAEEDFGIAMVEAQACGVPVIAYGRGGAADIVRTPDIDDAPTGILFDRQDEGSLLAAIDAFCRDEASFTAAACRANALRFAPARFRTELLAEVAAAAPHLSIPLPPHSHG